LQNNILESFGSYFEKKFWQEEIWQFSLKMDFLAGLENSQGNDKELFPPRVNMLSETLFSVQKFSVGTMRSVRKIDK